MPRVPRIGCFVSVTRDSDCISGGMGSPCQELPAAIAYSQPLSWPSRSQAIDFNHARTLSSCDYGINPVRQEFPSWLPIRLSLPENGALNPNLLHLLAYFPRPSVSHFGVSVGMTPLVYNTACAWLYLIDHVTGYFKSCADVGPLLPSSFSMAIGAMPIPYGLFASLVAVLLFAEFLTSNSF
eukprot:scaffold32705_cov76-Cyclotella_meneghiniana.AAC.5